MSMMDGSIRDFIREAGSATPTPGGGSIAALVGALGASMTSMAANFTKGAKYAEFAPQIDAALTRLSGITRLCEDLLEADIVSFERYMAAMKLPRDTEEQKAARKHAIQEASLEAIAIPLRLMEVCKDALAVTGDLAPYANKNVISDLGIGAILFEAAAQSAQLTVEINLAAMPETESRAELDHKSRELWQAILQRKEATVIEVRRRFAPT